MTTTKAEELAECWINPDPKHPDDWFSRFERAGWVRFVPAPVDQQAEREPLSDEQVLMISRRALDKCSDIEAQHIYVAREVERAAMLAAAPEIAESNEAESGRHNGLRHGVHSDLLLRDRAAAALAGVSGGSLADALWNSDEVMSLNAELDLTMDQLTRLARALLAATPQPAPAPPAREPGCDLGCSPEHARVVRLDKAQAAPEAQQPAGQEMPPPPQGPHQ